MAQSDHPQSTAKQPPEVEAAPPAQPQGPPPVETIYQPVMTEAVKMEDGLVVTFTVLRGMSVERHSYLVQKPGKENILDACTGGLVMPSHE